MAKDSFHSILSQQAEEINFQLYFVLFNPNLPFFLWLLLLSHLPSDSASSFIFTSSPSSHYLCLSFSIFLCTPHPLLTFLLNNSHTLPRFRSLYLFCIWWDLGLGPMVSRGLTRWRIENVWKPVKSHTTLPVRGYNAQREAQMTYIYVQIQATRQKQFLTSLSACAHCLDHY